MSGSLRYLASAVVLTEKTSTTRRAVVPTQIDPRDRGALARALVNRAWWQAPRSEVLSADQPPGG